MAPASLFTYDPGADPVDMLLSAAASLRQPDPARRVSGGWVVHFDISQVPSRLPTALLGDVGADGATTQPGAKGLRP